MPSPHFLPPSRFKLGFRGHPGLAFSPRYGPFGDLTLRLRRTARYVFALCAVVLAGTVGTFSVRDIVADGYLLAAQASYSLAA